MNQLKEPFSWSEEVEKEKRENEQFHRQWGNWEYTFSFITIWIITFIIIIITTTTIIIIISFLFHILFLLLLTQPPPPPPQSLRAPSPTFSTLSYRNVEQQHLLRQMICIQMVVKVTEVAIINSYSETNDYYYYCLGSYTYCIWKKQWRVSRIQELCVHCNMLNMTLTTDCVLDPLRQGDISTLIRSPQKLMASLVTVTISHG